MQKSVLDRLEAIESFLYEPSPSLHRNGWAVMWPSTSDTHLIRNIPDEWSFSRTSSGTNTIATFTVPFQGKINLSVEHYQSTTTTTGISVVVNGDEVDVKSRTSWTTENWTLELPQPLNTITLRHSDWRSTGTTERTTFFREVKLRGYLANQITG